MARQRASKRRHPARQQGGPARPILCAWRLRADVLRNVHPPIKESFALHFPSSRWVAFSGDVPAPIPRMIFFAKRIDLFAMLMAGGDALCARIALGK